MTATLWIKNSALHALNFHSSIQFPESANAFPDTSGSITAASPALKIKNGIASPNHALASMDSRESTINASKNVPKTQNETIWFVFAMLDWEMPAENVYPAPPTQSMFPHWTTASAD